MRRWTDDPNLIGVNPKLAPRTGELAIQKRGRGFFKTELERLLKKTRSEDALHLRPRHVWLRQRHGSVRRLRGVRHDRGQGRPRRAGVRRFHRRASQRPLRRGVGAGRGAANGGEGCELLSTGGLHRRYLWIFFRNSAISGIPPWKTRYPSWGSRSVISPQMGVSMIRLTSSRSSVWPRAQAGPVSPAMDHLLGRM